jgi:hypothetical protein
MNNKRKMKKKIEIRAEQVLPGSRDRGPGGEMTHTMYSHVKKKKKKKLMCWPGVVVYICNPNNSRGMDCKDHELSPAQAKS